MTGGLTKEHFDGSGSGQQTSSVGNPVPTSAAGGDGYPKSHSQSRSQFPQDSGLQGAEEKLKELHNKSKKGKAYIDKWGERMQQTCVLLKQVREPGVRGSYLKDSEKAEMYCLHRENPETYTVERLAKDYRIMRQRVHAVLWLKELEAERERKLGHPLMTLLTSCLTNSQNFSIHVIGNSMWQLFPISQISRLCQRVGMVQSEIRMRSTMRSQRKRMICYTAILF